MIKDSVNKTALLKADILKSFRLHSFSKNWKSHWWFFSDKPSTVDRTARPRRSARIKNFTQYHQQQAFTDTYGDTPPNTQQNTYSFLTMKYSPRKTSFWAIKLTSKELENWKNHRMCSLTKMSIKARNNKDNSKNFQTLKQSMCQNIKKNKVTARGMKIQHIKFVGHS